MRSGGEADKLANSYEGLWTIHQLFDVLDGQARSLTPEPLEDAVGIEFHKISANGARESHSVKIQTTRPSWTLSSLTQVRDNGRSYLGDLLEKTAYEPTAQACPVSEVSANALRILCDEARRAPDAATFHAYLEVAEARLRADFQSRLLPLCDGREDVAHDRLRRIHVSTSTRGDLVKIVNREITRSFFRHDGQTLDVDGVRRLLSEFILESLRKPVDRSAILERLSREGIGETDWARDPAIRELVQARNEAFLKHATQQLINDAPISRPEAAAALQRNYEWRSKIWTIHRHCRAGENLRNRRIGSAPSSGRHSMLVASHGRADR
jgi:hypothetical protein